MRLVARAVAAAALARTESRGAQQREDFPGMDDRWTVHLASRLRADELRLTELAPRAA